jgi:hypothetical protein
MQWRGQYQALIARSAPDSGSEDGIVRLPAKISRQVLLREYMKDLEVNEREKS